MKNTPRYWASMANKHTIQFNGHARLIGTANHEIKQLPPSIISRHSFIIVIQISDALKNKPTLDQK